MKEEWKIYISASKTEDGTEISKGTIPSRVSIEEAIAWLQKLKDNNN